jgi:hypothetical protein
LLCLVVEAGFLARRAILGGRMHHAARSAPLAAPAARRPRSQERLESPIMTH